MTPNYLSTLSKFDPQDKGKLQQFKRLPDPDHTKSEFFEVLEYVLIWIFLIGGCITFWIALFRALGA